LRERRAVFVTVPPLLSDILSEVVCRQGRLSLIAQFGDQTALRDRLPALAPDLVVIGVGAGEVDDVGRTVLGLVPSAKVLVISDDGRHAFLHEMRPHRKVLLDFSPASLMAALDLRAKPLS